MKPRHLFAALCAVSVSTAALAQAEKADLILYNGQVLTVDEDFRVESAVAVRGEHILAVGGDEILEEYSAPQTIDLKGRTLLPGFTDTHLHPVAISPHDILVGEAKSIAEVQEMLRAKARELGPGKWITGYGWAELLGMRTFGRVEPAKPSQPTRWSR